MNLPPDPEALARQRFMVINATRWSGVAIALFGVATAGGAIDLEPLAGYALIAFGAIDALVVPQVLARAWKSPPQ